MKIWRRFQAQGKAVKRLSYSTFAVVVYALLGFCLLPIIVQPMVIDVLSEKLDRKASIETIKINPFALSITINKLSITGKHTQQFLGFEKLIINFQALALFKQVIAFDEISIVRPSVSIIILDGGKFNFNDIVKKISHEKSKDSEQEEKKEGWPLVIDKFRYVEGSVYFEDRNRLTKFNSDVKSLSVSLDDFSTHPGEGNLHRVKAQTLRGTTIDWHGEFSLSPLRSKGHIELLGDLMVVSDYMQDQMRVKIDSGELDIKTDYEFKLAQSGSVFKISNTLAVISDLDVRRKDDAKILSWKQVSLRLSELDIINKKLVVDEVLTNDIAVKVAKDKNTNIDFGDLFVLQNLSSDAADSENGNVEKSQKNNAQWDVAITKISSNNSHVSLSDRSVNPSVEHELMFSLVQIKHLKPFADELADFKVALKINDKGLVDIEGSVQPVSRLIDFNLRSRSIVLKDYQSYVNQSMHVEILNGEFGSDLKVNINAATEVPAIIIAGDVHVTALTLRDKALKEKFLSWKKLSVNGFSLQLAQQQFDVSEIIINKPYLRLVMNGGGESNIQKLLIEKIQQQKKSAVQSEVKKSSFQVAIKNVKIMDAKMDFSDNSLSPNFSAGIYGLKGNISGLSSKQLSKAKVDLKGKVDKYAPVTIKGDINPLTKDKFTEIEMLFKGIELTTFTPYSGKFAGYKIEKGKLSLDLKYKLSENELIAENGVMLDQLTLGEKIDSEDATSLPVNFALSLLKDSNGVIDFNLPIRGNIDAPDFHYGSLVWGALGNLIVGIVSSPFKALANLAGGDGEGLDYIVFSANQSALQTSEKTKLDSLAKALLLRPELHLEIRGVTSSLVDHDAIAFLKVRKQLKLKPMPLMAVASDDDMDEMTDYYESITKLSVSDLLPKTHEFTAKQKDQFIYDKVLVVILNKTEVTQAEYLQLAKQRAENIQAYLIEVGKVPAANVFLLDSNTSLENKFEDVENARLQLPLSLKAK